MITNDETDRNAQLIKQEGEQSSFNMFSSSLLNSVLNSTTTNKRSLAIFDSFDQTSINDQTKDLVLELKWNERDLINLHLNQLSAFLLTANRPEIKQMLMNTNNEILFLLSNLPLSNLNSKSTKFTSDSGLNKKMKTDQNTSNDPTLEFAWTNRLRLIDHLILNKNLTILKADSIKSETKKQLLNENNKWIQVLQTLPVGIVIDGKLSVLVFKFDLFFKLLCCVF